MSLQALIDKQPVSRFPARCRVALVQGILSDADRDALVAAINNPTIPGSTIANAVAELGHDLSDQTINRHRRGRCRCGR